MLIIRKRHLLLLGLLTLTSSQSLLIFENHDLSSRFLNLTVLEVRDSYPPYQDFCLRNIGECILEGHSSIELTCGIYNELTKVNTTINHSIHFCFDIDQYPEEDYWAYPSNNLGDCEDIALKKREQLVEMGFPRAALRMAVGYHKKELFAHAVLTVETTKGTYVMDSLNDLVLPWYLTPYNYEKRERTDGKWDIYTQDNWEFN